MNSHLSKIALAGVLVVGLPLVIVQAQSEETPAEEPAVEEVVVEEAPVETPVVVEESAPAEETSPTTETPTLDGEVQGATTEQSASEEVSTSAPVEIVPLVAPLESDVATSSATSTPPEPPPAEKPVEETLVLQPEVNLQQSGTSLQATVTIQNLTSKDSDKTFSEAAVAIYYTPWYPNDGPESKETGEQSSKQTSTITSFAQGSSSDALTWSADLAPGHYYFVVVVDPENTLGAYRMQRTEVTI